MAIVYRRPSRIVQLGIRHSTTPPYHAQANPVERVNRVVKTMMTSFVESDHRDWDKYIPDFRFAYNTTVHSTVSMKKKVPRFPPTTVQCLSRLTGRSRRPVPKPREKKYWSQTGLEPCCLRGRMTLVPFSRPIVSSLFPGVPPLPSASPVICLAPRGDSDDRRIDANHPVIEALAEAILRNLYLII
ncbi:uncharacterized protein LOC117172875 [Belonocnema kinseyi]|uniref:uncharacterized protein LOC117172875 n=1 Tax=Belonocnema kinseyi TaxID=2817044 RepID=UPI00143DA18B|nr:uncharacterized protein LOC117172875 [Belonocnema kinseyi]